jgi:hypothetical protein
VCVTICMCMYVYVYLYICVCVYIYIYIYIHVCVYGVGILQRKPTGDLGIDPQKPTKLDVEHHWEQTSPGCGTNH